MELGLSLKLPTSLESSTMLHNRSSDTDAQGYAKCTIVAGTSHSPDSSQNHYILLYLGRWEEVDRSKLCRWPKQRICEEYASVGSSFARKESRTCFNGPLLPLGTAIRGVFEKSNRLALGRNRHRPRKALELEACRELGRSVKLP